MSHIQLQFVRARGLFSWMIARFGVQQPGFSHVDIVLPDGRLLGARDDAVGGEPAGVWIRPPNYEHWVRRQVLTYLCHPLGVKRAHDWAMGEISKKYDDDAIAGFIFGQRWHRHGDFICSVLAGNYLLHAGILHEDPASLQGTSPNALYAMSLAVGAKAA